MWQADEFQWPWFSPRGKGFLHELFADKKFTDESMVVVDHGRPLVGIYLSSHQAKGATYLTGFGLPTGYFVKSGLPREEEKKAAALILKKLDKIASSSEIVIKYRDFLRNGVVSPFGDYLLKNGAKASLYSTRVIDLHLEMDDIHRGIRKSYKSLVNWGLNNMELRIYDQDNYDPEALEQFRRFHIDIAGKETRNAESWRLQGEMIKAGEAFLVCGDWQGEVVTASLYLYSNPWCYYWVSASRRDLFDKPLSHCVLWTAIKKAKELGCKKFEVGEQILCTSQGTHVDNKLLGISKFKAGFGGDDLVQLDLELHKGAAFKG